MPKPAKITPPPLPESLQNVCFRIAKFRKQRGLSQEALAEVIGVSRKQVSDYERGKANLNHEMVIRFALALGISTDELLGLSSLAQSVDQIPLRFTRRMRELQVLSEDKKKAILKVLDDLIRANS